MPLFDAYSKRRARRKFASDGIESEHPTIPDRQTTGDPVESGAARAGRDSRRVIRSRNEPNQMLGITSAPSDFLVGRSYDAWLTEGRARQRSNRDVARVGKAWK